MEDRFRAYSGGIYTDSHVAIHVDDGRSFVRRSPRRYDVIQASLVDTLGRDGRRRVHAHRELALHRRSVREYIDHLTDRGLLTITRWVFDGLRLVSLRKPPAPSAASTPRNTSPSSASIASPRFC
jgi:hypothetical protein